MPRQGQVREWLEVECPQCGAQFQALSPPDRATPDAVYPDGACAFGCWLSRFTRFTDVDCPGPECRARTRLMWVYARGRWLRPFWRRRRKGEPQ